MIELHLFIVFLDLKFAFEIIVLILSDVYRPFERLPIDVFSRDYDIMTWADQGDHGERIRLRFSDGARYVLTEISPGGGGQPGRHGT